MPEPGKAESSNIPKVFSAAAGDVVPKFCTSVNLAALQKSKNIVMSFLYHESVDRTYLIERVVIDWDHLRDLKKVIDEILEKGQPLEG